MTRLSLEDLLSGRSVCQDFKIEAEKVLKTIDRLWLRKESASDESFQCFHSFHYIGVKHCIWFPDITSPFSMEYDDERKWYPSKELCMISSLLPSVKILRIDPWNGNTRVPSYYLHDTKAFLDFGQLFPNMECLVAPAEVKQSQLSGEKIKHLYVTTLQPNSTTAEAPCNLPFLESLHIIQGPVVCPYSYPPIPSKRFICEKGLWFSWERIPSSIEVLHTWVAFDDRYTRQYRQTHPNLKSLGNQMLGFHSDPEKLKEFILDNQESITNLSVILGPNYVEDTTLRSFCECLFGIQTLSLKLNNLFADSLDSRIMKILKEQLPTQAPSLRKLHVTLYCAKMSGIQDCLHHMPTNTTTLTMKFKENSYLRKPDVKVINKIVLMMESGIIQEVIHKGVSGFHRRELEKLLECYSFRTKNFNLVAETEKSFEETDIVVRQKPPNSLERQQV